MEKGAFAEPEPGQLSASSAECLPDETQGARMSSNSGFWKRFVDWACASGAIPARAKRARARALAGPAKRAGRGCCRPDQPPRNRRRPARGVSCSSHAPLRVNRPAGGSSGLFGRLLLRCYCRVAFARSPSMRKPGSCFCSSWPGRPARTAGQSKPSPPARTILQTSTSCKPATSHRNRCRNCRRSGGLP